MAAPTTEQIGIDFLLKSGGVSIGGRRGATLTKSVALEDVSYVDTGLADVFAQNTREWSISYDGLFLEGASPADVAADGATLQVLKTAPSTYVTLAGTNNLSLALSLNTVDLSNDSSRNRRIIPVSYGYVINTDFDYIDPAGTAGEALDLLLDAEEAGTTKAIKLAWGGQGSYVTGSVHPNSQSLQFPHRERVTGSLTLTGHGTLTLSLTNEDAALGAIIDSMVADPATVLTVLMATATSGATQWTGSAYSQSLTLNINRGSRIGVSGTLIGHGALTRGTTT